MGFLNLKELNADELLMIRRQIVRQKKKGLSGKEIESLTGVRCNRISEIWSKYQAGGDAALKPKQRGRKKGERTLLTREQEEEIRRLIIDHTPDQLKLAFMLWTRQAISDLIMLKYNLYASLRSVTNYLNRWGFTCQRPTKRAYSQDNVKVKSFMENEYPEIARRALAENAEIYWGDETGVSSQEYYVRGFSIKGVTPVLPFEAKHERINMISAISGRGTVRFMVYEGTMNQQLLIEYMERLIKDAQRKVFLIIDNLRVHHGKIVAEWLHEHKHEIEVFFLPSYSPELNPDEYLNHVLKKNVHSGIRPRTKKELRNKTESFMGCMEQNHKQVAALFNHKKLTYIRQYHWSKVSGF
jgi:transposase